MPGIKQKSFSLEESSWVQVNCADCKVIILINATKKIHGITANPRSHYHWNNLSILCAVLSTSGYPCICTYFATCPLCFSLLEQLPKDMNEGVLELLQRAELYARGYEGEEQTASFTATLSSGWLHICDWATDPLSTPGKEKGRLVPAIKKGKEGKVLIPSSGGVYSVPYLASARSFVALLFTAFNL